MAILDLPTIDSLRGYRSVYALCTTDKDGRALKATHIASVLIGGPNPTWGVWTVRGKFQRYHSSRADIEETYPRLTWRRIMATWAAVDMHDKSLEKRRFELEDLYGRKLPNHHHEDA
jgi:hypothetical protein